MHPHTPKRDDLEQLWRLDPPGKSRPLIGIAPDVVEPKPGSIRAMCALTYAKAISLAGGEPVILPPIVELIPRQLAMCAGFVLTGGDDPRTEPFGKPTHPQACVVHPLRQEYDTALLKALLARTDVPTLGVCLGMQMMALVAGGEINQHLPDTLTTAAGHANNSVHRVQPAAADGVLAALSGSVTSHHHQSVQNPGSMRTVMTSDDGVIEAIDRPGAPFFVGVQWHPERTDDEALGKGLFVHLVNHARKYIDRRT